MRPVHLSHVRPRFEPEVRAKTESLRRFRSWFERGPFSDLRILPVRSYQPAIGKRFLRRGHLGVIDSVHSRAPAKFHAGGDGLFRKHMVQLCPAHGKSVGVREWRSRAIRFIHKLNSTERKAARRGKAYTQLPQCGHAVRQNSFSAGLIDGRFSSIQHRHREALHACCNSRYDPGRPSANNDDIAPCSHSYDVGCSGDR